MKQLTAVIIGILIGFLVARRVGTGTAPSRLLAEVDARRRAFAGAVADGYRSRDAELRTDD